METPTRPSSESGAVTPCIFSVDVSVDELALHRMDRDPPHDECEADEEQDAKRVGRLEAEDGMSDELDTVVEGVQLGEHLRPLGERADGEEGACDEKERRQNGAHDVVE